MIAPPTVYDYTNPLNILVALLILVIGVFGLSCNLSIVYIFIKQRTERTSFNCICLFRSLSNVCILSATFILLFLPKTILGYSPYSPAVENALIHFANTLYMGNEYQIILVAINRFCSLYLPLYYPILCGQIPTTIILIVIYSIRIYIFVREVIDKTASQCFSSYSTESLMWGYSEEDRCKSDDDIFEVITATFITMSIINLITLARIIYFYKSSHMGTRESKKRIIKNTFLFIQTMLQDSLYLIDLTFMFKLSGLSTERYWTFISGTLVWECVHSIDGFIMTLFNEKLSVIKHKLWTPSASVTKVVAIA